MLCILDQTDPNAKTSESPTMDSKEMLLHDDFAEEDTNKKRLKLSVPKPQGLADVMSKILKKSAQKNEVILVKGKSDRELSKRRKTQKSDEFKIVGSTQPADEESDSSEDEQDSNTLRGSAVKVLSSYHKIRN